MTEASAGPESAGAILRAARERQGLHIAALAAAIKVAPRKLDALEKDRWHELPDATFTRALAQTVCRTLKIDPRPVLDLLPAVEAAGLDNVTGSLNTPFHERGTPSDGASMAAAIRPMVLAGIGLLVAAVAIYFLPADIWPTGDRTASQTATPVTAVAPSASAPLAAPDRPASGVELQPVAGSASEPGRAALVVPDSILVAAPAAAAASVASPGRAAAVATTGASTGVGVPVLRVPDPATAAAPARIATTVAQGASAPAALASTAGPVQLRALEASWVEARDGQGRVLVSRVLASGESLGLEGALPIRLTIGNAKGTTVALRGRIVDLATSTRDNVARLELQ
jgi:cytoskeleton protein RodZ